jgi:hypothetical protein
VSLPQHSVAWAKCLGVTRYLVVQPSACTDSTSFLGGRLLSSQWDDAEEEEKNANASYNKERTLIKKGLQAVAELFKETSKKRCSTFA